MKPGIALPCAEADDILLGRRPLLLEIGVGDALRLLLALFLLRFLLGGFFLLGFLLSSGLLGFVAFGLVLVLGLGDFGVSRFGRRRRPEIVAEGNPADHDEGAENKS